MTLIQVADDHSDCQSHNHIMGKIRTDSVKFPEVVVAYINFINNIA